MTDKAKTRSDKLPLMDEVNELIEKERTLLNLKLLAKNSEAAEWKTKYDLLLEKVGTVTVSDFTGQQPLEIAAEIEAEVGDGGLPTFQDLQRRVHERTHPWILDLSDLKNLDKTMFAKLAKAVFGARSVYEVISTLRLSHCALTDEYTSTILAMVRSSRLQALDLSFNELGELFFVQMVAALKVRYRFLVFTSFSLIFYCVLSRIGEILPNISCWKEIQCSVQLSNILQQFWMR
jgi:hypothetical protein